MHSSTFRERQQSKQFQSSNNYEMSFLKKNLLSIMIKLLYSILFLLLFPNVLLSQNQDKLWMMGYDCCGPNFSGINMDFRSGSLVVGPVVRHFNFAETNGQICDSAGNILFCSNGIYVANTLFDTMLNGSGLNPSDYTTAHELRGLHIPQANLILPIPGDPNKYYLFHETSDDRFNTYATFYLYYSIIDMTLDGGLGGVIQKNTVLLHDSLVEGELIACKHANGRDWWLFSHKFESDTFYKFLVTPTAIQGPWIDETGFWRTNYFGQTVFSPDGSKFVYFEAMNGLDIWDFDRCTGSLNNLIHIPFNDSIAAGGAAFSRSGRYLYVSAVYKLYQLDLLSTNIAASLDTIAIYDGFSSGGLPTVFYQLQLAPDDKIYSNSTSSVLDYHVINFPDSAGLACNIQQHSIHLPGYSVSLPNHPNYFLGAEHGSICDSLTNDVPFISSSLELFTFFPNPVKNLLYINQSKNEIIITVKIFNSLGQLQKVEYSSFKNGEYIEVNTNSLKAGFYFLEMQTNKQKVVKRFVKV